MAKGAGPLGSRTAEARPSMSVSARVCAQRARAGSKPKGRAEIPHDVVPLLARARARYATRPDVAHLASH